MRRPYDVKTEGKTTPIKVADQVWIATALLHRAHPDREDFLVSEIVDEVRARLSQEYRHSIRVHAMQHCVATLPPVSGTYRMLTWTGPRTRRLYRTGDAAAPGRKGKITPLRDEIPDQYHELLDWYASEYDRAARGDTSADALLALRGSGRRLWAHEHADEYVKRLREGWA
jgi:hypothetical protein